MITRTCLILVLIASYLCSWSQPGRHTVSIELRGVAVLASVNYQVVLVRSKSGFLSARVGAGVDSYIVPAFVHGITYCVGREKHFFEAGTLGRLGNSSLGFADAPSTLYAVGPSVGYRRHSSTGFFFALSMSALVPLGSKLGTIMLPGMSLGYTLRSRKE